MMAFGKLDGVRFDGRFLVKKSHFGMCRFGLGMFSMGLIPRISAGLCFIDCYEVHVMT